MPAASGSAWIRAPARAGPGRGLRLRSAPGPCLAAPPIRGAHLAQDRPRGHPSRRRCLPGARPARVCRNAPARAAAGREAPQGLAPRPRAAQVGGGGGGVPARRPSALRPCSAPRRRRGAPLRAILVPFRAQLQPDPRVDLWAPRFCWTVCVQTSAGFLCAGRGGGLLRPVPPVRYTAIGLRGHLFRARISVLAMHAEK